MGPEFHALGKGLLIMGGVLTGLGALLLWGPKLSWFGHLPGDIAIQRNGFSLYAPITSGLLISAVVSLILWVVGRLR